MLMRCLAEPEASSAAALSIRRLCDGCAGLLAAGSMEPLLQLYRQVQGSGDVAANSFDLDLDEDDVQQVGGRRRCRGWAAGGLWVLAGMCCCSCCGRWVAWRAAWGHADRPAPACKLLLLCSVHCCCAVHLLRKRCQSRVPPASSSARPLTPPPGPNPRPAAAAD